jgi:deoxyribonuclease-4
MLRFGTGGVPISTQIVKDGSGKALDSQQSGVIRVNGLGLDHMEVDFVYGVNITEERAIALGKTAADQNISLTAHGPYYVNLASPEKPKYHASFERIKETIRAGDLIGAKSITFHAAFYLKQPPEEVSKIIKNALIKVIRETKPKCLISPETTGKPSQWGTVEEIAATAAEINDELGKFAVSICVDFTHLHARSNGQMNTAEEFEQTLTIIKEKISSEALTQLHMHVSGINYTNKGEKNHLNLENSDFNYRDLLKVLKKMQVSGWLVCESPNLEEDAKLMKDFYNSIK